MASAPARYSRLRPWFQLGVGLLGDPRSLPLRAAGFYPYLRNMRAYARQQAAVSPSLRLRPTGLYPALTDRYRQAGSARGHYFHQDLWAARRIYERNPRMHVDIGSRLDGFVAHLLTFRDVIELDIRPLSARLGGLQFVQGNVLSLPWANDSLESLSTLHVIEHIGLGRYADAVDPQGCFRAMDELGRVLAPGGRLYLSLPIGRERLEFDAHRVLSPLTVIQGLPQLELVEFSAVNDNGDLVEYTKPEDYADAEYSCGLFIFAKQHASLPRSTGNSR